MSFEMALPGLSVQALLNKPPSVDQFLSFVEALRRDSAGAILQQLFDPARTFQQWLETMWEDFHCGNPKVSYRDVAPDHVDINSLKAWLLYVVTRMRVHSPGTVLPFTAYLYTCVARRVRSETVGADQQVLREVQPRATTQGSRKRTIRYLEADENVDAGNEENGRSKKPRIETEGENRGEKPPPRTFYTARRSNPPRYRLPQPKSKRPAVGTPANVTVGSLSAESDPQRIVLK